MRWNSLWKLILKKIGVEVEADTESLIEKGINVHEKDWKEKLESKTKSKKEIIELKHKNKMEEKYFENNGKSLISKEEKSKKVVRIISIILFFIYGLFFIEGFNDSHIISAIITVIQMILVIISILSSLNTISLFKKDYKVCLLISLMLIIPWMAFAI